MLTVPERVGDREETFRRMMDGQQAGMWTALPGIVVSYNAAAGTVVVQPTVQSTITQPDGTVRQATLPVLADVPVVFPGGGGATLTFPIQANDECLIIFSSRSIDGWWNSGGVQPAAMPRMHNLSDGFALVGVRSRGRALAGASTSATVLRSDSGNATIALSPGNGHVTVVAQEVEATAPTIKLNGTVEIVGELKVNNIVFSTHRHTGVQSGGSVSAGPIN